MSILQLLCEDGKYGDRLIRVLNDLPSAVFHDIADVGVKLVLSHSTNDIVDKGTRNLENGPRIREIIPNGSNGVKVVDDLIHGEAVKVGHECPFHLVLGEELWKMRKRKRSTRFSPFMIWRRKKISTRFGSGK